MFNPTLSCVQVNDFILDYLEGRLPDETREKFEKHMETCPPCERYLEQYKQTVAIVSEIGKIDAPSDLAEHTMAFLKQNLPNFQS